MRASSLPLLTKCPGSASLPQTKEESEEAKVGAIWGSLVHIWKETGEVRQPREADRQADTRTLNALRKALEVSGIDRQTLWPAGGVHEQRVGVRVDGRREAALDGVSEREGSWITGTDDFQHWLEPFGGGDKPELWVDDLKTGKWYDDPDEPGANRFPQDPRSPQVRLYALAVCVALDYHGPVHISITHWPRLPMARRHSPPERLWDTVDSEWLRTVFWEQLETLYQEKQVNDKLLAAGDPEKLH